MKLFFFLLCVLLLKYTSATDIYDGNGNTVDISDAKFFELKGDALREGFQVFYSMSNYIIDNVFEPKLSLKLVQEIIYEFEKSFEIGDYIKVPQKAYPSLFYFIIATLVLGLVLIPVLGIIICTYRVCCRKKSDPCERKGDSARRKVYGFFLFLVIMLMLIATVVLFFTNQNSFTAVKNIDVVLKNINEDLNKVNNDNMIIFYESISTNLKIEKNESSILITDISEKFIESFSNVLLESNLIATLKDDVQNITTLAQVSDHPDLIVETIQKDLNTSQIITDLMAKIKQKLEEIDSDIDFPLSDDMVENLKSIVDTNVDYFNKTLAPKIEDFLKNYLSYYDYFYVGLIIISVFFLILFLTYSLGLLGVCARKSRLNHKPSCQRRCHAGLIITGITLFFIFAGLVLVLALTLYVPGIIMRHGVCKLAIEIETNQLYKDFVPLIPIYNDTQAYLNLSISDIQVTKILREFDTYGKSFSLKKSLEQILDNVLSNEFDNVVTNLLPLNTSTEMKKFYSELFRNLENLLDKAIELKNHDSTDDDSTLENLIEYLGRMIDRLRNDLIVGQESEQYLDLISDLEKVKNDTHENVISTLISLVSGRVERVFDDIPEICRFISETYKVITRTSCFETLDNLNTYWVNIIALVLLNLLATFFGLKIADIFRKRYAYDGMSEDLSNVSSKDYYSKSRSKSKETMMKYADSDSAIDAFEMGECNNRASENRVNYSNGSPPPGYYRPNY